MPGSFSRRIGVLHLAPLLGEVESNRALLERATRLAAEMGAEWILSGELVVPGYRFEPRIGTDWITPQPDTWLRSFADLGASLGVVSFVGHPERDESSGRLYNTLFVIGRDGQILGRQRKLNPTPEAEDWSSPGELQDPMAVDGIRVGLLVCADAYPQGPALRLRELGAELFVSVAAWWPGEWGPKGEWEARTLETGVPMIVCNRTGVDGDTQLFEAESVFVDRGRKLASLRSWHSSVFVVDCRIREGRLTASSVTEAAI
jgi:predicted amidohydrolase